MNKLAFYLTLALVTFSLKLFSQENFENKVKTIARNISEISKKEKEKLKEEIRILDEKWNKKEITNEQYETEKKKVAEKYATIISEKVTIEEEKLKTLVKEKAENSIVEIENDTTLKLTNRLLFITNKDSLMKNKELRNESRNTIKFVFALGINNAIAKGERLDNSSFKTWGSHFYEIGFSNNYRILKENNLLKFKYGLSLVYNNLRPINNQYFEVKGNQTILEKNLIELEDSRLRIIQLNLPLYFEFDFNNKKTNNEGKKFFKSNRGFKLGIGGYVGANISTRQHLEYSDNGLEIETVERGDFNTYDINYGLGAYLGYKGVSLYTKYDLQPVFKNNTQDINNISVGIRFE